VKLLEKDINIFKFTIHKSQLFSHFMQLKIGLTYQQTKQSVKIDQHLDSYMNNLMWEKNYKIIIHQETFTTNNNNGYKNFLI
jgi:hypothetical protein